jgi:hypothetical protein
MTWNALSRIVGSPIVVPPFRLRFNAELIWNFGESQEG